MSTFKHPLHARCNNVVKSGLCFLMLTLLVAVSPAVNPFQKVQAAIDEAEPSTFPADVVADWKDQGGTAADIKAALPDKYKEKAGSSLESACHWRRVARLAPYADIIEKVMFCDHHEFGGMVVGYHDNVDAGNCDDQWTGSSKLNVLNFKTYYPETQTLLSESKVIRDPCISFDGTKCLIAISGSGSKGSGYSIYEFKIDDPKGSLKQITKQMDGISTADFEPCYLPTGEIAFTSSRNYGFTDCAYQPTDNMFIMRGDGTCMRQVGFDQVHTFYPQVKGDGSVLFTRWEYNDRDLQNSMGLFFMYPDGSHQTEWYGNQTNWPFTMIHGRPVPGSMKAVAIAGGHHGRYSGELMLLDNTKTFNGPEGITMIAPKRETKPSTKTSDQAQGNVTFTFMYPYPLSENDFLVSWRKSNSGNFKLYWMDQDGNRELLASGTKSACQAVPITTWKKLWGEDKPSSPKVQADYTKSEGTFTMENVYGDPYCGLKKMDPIPQGTAKSLRVVALGYRAQGGGKFGSVMGSGPSGVFTPAIFCPIATYGCSWEAKKVLGEAKIYEDGSANFKVPARTPVYFQVLNEKGYCIATMRSWSTLMPGETFSCFGCHESKTSAPPTTGMTQAMKNPPEVLAKTLGVEDKWFDFKKFVAPVLAKNCGTSGCHTGNHTSGFDMSSGDGSAASRSWAKSYISLTKGVSTSGSNKAINISYIFQQSVPEPYGSFGSTKSGMIKNIDAKHKDVALSDTARKIIACWIDLAAPHGGYYNDYLSNASGYDALEAKRTKWIDMEKKNIADLISTTQTIQDKRGKSATSGTSVEKIRIGYLPTMRKLVLTNVAKGSLTLVDLRGREICRMLLSDLQKDADVQIPLPKSVGTGLYVAKFQGIDGKVQKGKITITE